MNQAPVAPVLEVRHLSKSFTVTGGLLRQSKGTLRAVDGASLAISLGETLRIVGQFGCGKFTLGWLALGLIDPYGGQILIEGRDVTALSLRSRCDRSSGACRWCFRILMPC
jgi:ABC-type oligopeptide transport system ATPase subunit